jgi:hypothetical protein
MKKSLYTALGLVVALAVAAPALVTGANAAAATTAAPTSTVKKPAHKHHVKKVHKTIKHTKKPAAKTM